MPAMIQGAFDFFFATGCGSGAEGAAAGNGADGAGDVTTIGVGGRAATSPVVRSAGCSTAGGGGGGGLTGGGGGGGGVAGREMPAVSGDVAVAPVVGPVLRGGNATVAG